MSIIIRLFTSKGMELTETSSHHTRQMQHVLCTNLQGGFGKNLCPVNSLCSVRQVRGEKWILMNVGHQHPQQFYGLGNVIEFSLLITRDIYMNAMSERCASFKPALAKQLKKKSIRHHFRKDLE